MNYNYKRFRNKEYNTPSNTLQVGQKFPFNRVFNLNGEEKLISDYLDQPIVIETGSYTCGMFAGQNEKMEQLAKMYSNYNFKILYVREVHPGKQTPEHDNFRTKLQLANKLKIDDNIENREIIIDDFNGTLHQNLGAMPNMIFIIDKEGTILFKNEWNNSKSLQIALEKLKTSVKSIPQKWEMLPFPKINSEYKIFKRAGWDAGLDFIIALPLLIIKHLIQFLKK